MLSFRVLWDSLNILILRGSYVWSRDQELIPPARETLPQAASQFAPNPLLPSHVRPESACIDLLSAQECKSRAAAGCLRQIPTQFGSPSAKIDSAQTFVLTWRDVCPGFHLMHRLIFCLVLSLSPSVRGILPIADEVCQHHTIPNPADKSYSLIGLESALGCCKLNNLYPCDGVSF